MPSLPHLGSRTPLSLLRAAKNHREQQEMNPTSKGAGQPASPLKQLYRLASQILKTPSDWHLLTHITEGPETPKFHPYPYPAYNSLWDRGKRRRFGIRLFESQVHHSS